MRPKQKKWEHIGAVLGNDRRSPWKRRIKKYALWERWEDLVGKSIAAHARPHSWQKNVLVINVIHSTWMSELQYFREEILEKIRAEYPSVKISGLRFQMGRPEDFRTRVKHKPDPSRISTADLSSAEMEFVDDTVRPIKDDTIRETVRRLISKDLSLKKDNR